MLCRTRRQSLRHRRLLKASSGTFRTFQNDVHAHARPDGCHAGVRDVFRVLRR